MKTTCLILLSVGASLLTLQAQPFEAKQDPQATTQRDESTALQLYRAEAPNKIQGKGVSWSGAGPHAIKLRNPLQLINPFAPLEKGRGDENLAEPMPGDKGRRISVL